MRQAFKNLGWMLDEQGQTLGISLGFDFCAEHEWGVKELQQSLGVELPEFPMGVEDRLVRKIPPGLVLVESDRRPKGDKRRKSQKVVSLGFLRSAAADLPQLVSTLDFFCEPYDKYHDPEKHDLVAAWSSRQFLVRVRGEAHIERLKDLHAAFLRRDVAMALPWVEGFMRGGLSFVIVSRMSPEQKAQVLARDQDHRELTLAVRATGVEALLEERGKGWYALKPAWRDASKQEVRFFLNPRDQQNHHHGWFTVEELKEWAVSGTGPVVRDARLEEWAEQPEIEGKIEALRQNLRRHGIGLARVIRSVWLDAAQTQPGIELATAPDSEDRLPRGKYSLEDPRLLSLAEPSPARPTVDDAVEALATASEPAAGTKA